MIRAASSSGKPPTPVPNATSASDLQPSFSATRSVERVARSITSADVGPPSSIVAAWITQRAGRSPAGRLDRFAQLDRRALPRLALELGPGGALDRAGHAAAVQELRVRRVRDRVHVELRDVCLNHLERGHPGKLRANACLGSRDRGRRWARGARVEPGPRDLPRDRAHRRRSRSSTWSSTTWRSRTGSCARCATGRRRSSAGRRASSPGSCSRPATARRATPSTRSAS